MNAPFTVAVVPKPVTQEIAKVQMAMPMFALNATEGSVYTTLLTEDNKFVDRSLIKIPADVYASWAQDDSLVVSYVLEQLGLTQLS